MFQLEVCVLAHEDTVLVKKKQKKKKEKPCKLKKSKLYKQSKTIIIEVKQANVKWNNAN